MRTHYLKNLAISGREKALALEPDFDFYRANKVLGIHIEFDSDLGELPSLRLSVEYRGDARRYELKLLFEGVRELSASRNVPLAFYA